MAGYDSAGYGYGPGRAQARYGYSPQHAHDPRGTSAWPGGYAPDPYAQAEPDDPTLSQPHQPSSTMAWIGALGSVCLVLGLGVWGYSLATRDVSQVPVIRALEGDAYVKHTPEEDPGAVRRTLSVDEIQGGTVTTAAVDRVRVAPDPDPITPIDVPGAQSTSTQPATAPSGTVPSAESLAEMVDRLAAGATPLSGVEVPPSPTPVTPSVSTTQTPQSPELTDRIAVLPASVPGLARAPRPASRPAGLVDRSLASRAVQVPDTPVTQFADPETLAPGTLVVQFSAQTSRAAAEADWDRLSRAFGTYLRGKSPVIQTAIVAGQRYHRLRVMNFANARDARQFCAVFMANGQQCFLTEVN